MQILLIVLFGLINATVNRAGKLLLSSGNFAGFLTLREDLSDVGIVCFVHAVSMTRNGGHFNPLCDSCQIVPSAISPMISRAVAAKLM